MGKSSVACSFSRWIEPFFVAFPLLTDATLTQQLKITKLAERSQHDRTNTIQRDWTGYVVAGQQGNN